MVLDTDKIAETGASLAFLGLSVGVAKKTLDWGLSKTKTKKGKSKGFW